MDEKRAMMNGVVMGNRPVAPDHFLLTVRTPQGFTEPLPGQFVMIRETLRTEPLLARPLSVFGYKRLEDHGVLEILCRVAGRVTAALANLKPGEELAILGPIGRGFTLPAGIGQVIFVAGGVGVAPLAYLLHSGLLMSKTGPELGKHFYLGARSAELLAGVERLRDFCELGVCTDDGSQGYHGPVTSLLHRDIDRFDPGKTIIYACGPAPMIRALRSLLREHPIPCQVSLEERMACGLGACLGCAVAIRGPEGKREYRRVCQDGPVFDLREVLFAKTRGT